MFKNNDALKYVSYSKYIVGFLMKRSPDKPVHTAKAYLRRGFNYCFNAFSKVCCFYMDTPYLHTCGPDFAHYIWPLEDCCNVCIISPVYINYPDVYVFIWTKLCMRSDHVNMPMLQIVLNYQACGILIQSYGRIYRVFTDVKC